METIAIRIDDQDILAQKDASILEVALINNIYIPHLCYHPDLKPAGSCRLCLVEIENGQLVTSCRTPVTENMVIKTKSPQLDKIRRPIIEMLIANHHMDCRNCVKKGRCSLQRIRAYMRLDKKSLQRLRFPKEELPTDISNPFFERDLNKCVLCGICVRTCQEIPKVNAIDFVGRGYTTKIAAFGNSPIAQSACVSCGECVIRCPVSALVPKDFRRPAIEVRTVCPNCGVGCGIFLGTRDDVIVSVRGDDNSPVSKGNLCVRGRFGLSFVHSTERVTSPLIKRNGKFIGVSWDEAIDFVVHKLRNYQGNEFALLASPHCTNEDNYIAQKFARVVIGSNNIDNSARLCHAPTTTAMFEATGMGTINSSLGDIEKAACIVVIGTNPTKSHPIAGVRIKEAVENGAKLIVINPKEIDLCRFAEIWLRLHPGTDTALLMGMCNVIVGEGLLDTAFIEKRCNNFEDFKNSLDDFPLGRVERITGVSRDLVAEAAKVYATTKPAALLWSSGAAQFSHGINNIFSLINLVLLTGNITKTSSALTPLWGKSNALGACDMGCLPNFYPGYQEVARPPVRKKFESSWGKSLNPDPGLTFTEIIRSTHEGKIKVLYIIGSNPVMTVPPHQKVKEALEGTDLIILQDIFFNETAKFADVILPAAGFAEKEGTFTNTERRVQTIHKAIEPLGSSCPDWKIICDLAKKLGNNGFDFTNPEEIMSEITSVTPLYSNISYSSLKKGNSGWPVLAEENPFNSNRTFRFTPLQYNPPAGASDIDYPLVLTTERDIYSGGFLSRNVEGLKTLGNKKAIYINPKDAADFGIKDGETVRVISRWGEITGKAKLAGTSPPGLVTMNLFEGEINRLINPSLDSISKTMETKVCAVRITPQEEPRNE